jgi:hypothetical protein
VLDYDRIAAEWKVRTVLFAGADRYDEPRVIAEYGCDLGGVQLLDP